jgi:hypothetical protein
MVLILYFILNRSQRINWLKTNLNFRVKYSTLNDYPNEIRKFLINNLTLFIDDGDLSNKQNIQTYIPSLSSSSTSNNNNNNDNNDNENEENEENEEEEEIKKTKTLSIIKTLSIAFYAVYKNKETNEDEYQVGYKDLRDGEDFIEQWLDKLFEVAEKVAESNKYDCIDYSYENIYNDVPVIGFNSGHFDNNVLLPYFHNPPKRYVENLIGTENFV